MVFVSKLHHEISAKLPSGRSTPLYLTRTCSRRFIPGLDFSLILASFVNPEIFRANLRIKGSTRTTSITGVANCAHVISNCVGLNRE